MSIGIVVAQAVPGNAGIVLLARIANYLRALVNQASVTSITYTAYDVTAGEQLATGTLTVSSVVYDTLQQSDPTWVKDDADNPGTDGRWGYNFRAVLPASTVPVASSGHRVQVDVVVTPSDGSPALRIIFNFPTLKVYA